MIFTKKQMHELSKIVRGDPSLVLTSLTFKPRILAMRCHVKWYFTPSNWREKVQRKIKIVPPPQLLKQQQYCARKLQFRHILADTELFFTTSTTALKLNGSYMARLLKIFLSRVIPLLFCIAIKLE
mmetsp:Transcript_4144/g.8197  ORF Transcript_4144/g.8197 Transcript_4144/m.8197 type:complete len:126 (+) Transcript_4144:62-439(+)